MGYLVGMTVGSKAALGVRFLSSFRCARIPLSALYGSYQSDYTCCRELAMKCQRSEIATRLASPFSPGVRPNLRKCFNFQKFFKGVWKIIVSMFNKVIKASLRDQRFSNPGHFRGE